MTFLKKVFGSHEKKAKTGNETLPMPSTDGSSTSNQLAYQVISPSPIKMAVPMVDNQTPYGVHPVVDPSSQPQSFGYAFDEFEVTRTLGTGSFGRVCLALHRPTGQFFAMKKLRKSDVIRLKQVEHTNNERALLARASHPFLVKMVYTHQDERHLYIFLEYVPGGEMFSLLRRVRVNTHY